MNPSATQGAAPAPAIDPNALAQALVKAGAFPQQAQQQVQQPPSQEELDAKFHRFKLTPAHYQALFGEQATEQGRMAALNEWHTGAQREAMAQAFYLSQHLLQEQMKQIQPYLDAAHELQDRALYQDFYEMNPTLKPYDQLVRNAVTELASSQGTLPSNRKDMFGVLAGRAEQLVKAVNPAFSLQAQATQQQAGTPRPGVPDFGAGQPLPPQGQGQAQPTPQPFLQPASFSAGGGHGGVAAGAAPVPAAVGQKATVKPNFLD